MRWPRLKVRNDPDFVPERRRYTTDDYAAWLSQSMGWGTFGFQGSQYPLGVMTTQPGAKTEPIGDNFTGYVNHGLKGNGIVWTCESIRLEVFAQARFKFRQLNRGKPGDLFGTTALRPLERPGFMAEALFDADLAGNYYGALVEGELVRLRPDWVDIVLEPVRVGSSKVGFRKRGYFYYDEGHRDAQPVVLLPREVVHWAPKPDPLGSFRGMSWLTPLVREVLGDTAYTRHKSNFVDNAATPNLAVTISKEVSPTQFDAFVEKMDARHNGPQNAGSTLYLGGGADVTVVGADMRQLDFKIVQGAGESRIAAAAGVGAVIAQFSEGMQGSSLNAGNYQASRRRFADITMRYLWQEASAVFANAVAVPAGAELWYDANGISFLQEDAKDAAEITQIQMATIANLVKEGFEHESAKAAVVAGDPTLLKHTGLVSVQLQPPGTQLAPSNGSQPTVPVASSNGGQ
jgi:Phage portal protein